MTQKLANSISDILRPRGFKSRVNTHNRPKFIEVARIFVIDKEDNTFTSHDMAGLANRYGYSRQSPGNALLKLEADGVIERTRDRQYIPGSKKLGIVYKATSAG